MINEYAERATDFLKKNHVDIRIDFVGLAVNKDWREQEKRNLYTVTLTSPLGSMVFDFWDSIHNTEIQTMTIDQYVKKSRKVSYDSLSYTEKFAAQREFRAKQSEAIPTAYDVLACITKYDPGTFEDFCSEFGYDKDSTTASKTYLAVQKEYTRLKKVLTSEQMEELQEIN